MGTACWRAATALAVLAIGVGGVTQDVQAWGVDPLTKVMRDAAPTTTAKPVRMEGARGEIVSGQAVFRPSVDANAVTASVTDLKNGPYTIPAARIRLQWVRYIAVTRNTAGVPADELVAKAPCSIPDPYWDSPTVDVAGGSAQPLWIEIGVPRGTSPGEYSGLLKFQWGGGSAELPIRMTVWDFDLPAERHQQVTNWFRFPGEGYKIERGSPEYWALAARFADALVAHRQTCFIAFLADIKTTYDPEKRFVCDFGYLDRWAETFFAAGMERLELVWTGKRTARVDNPSARILPADIVVEVSDPSVSLTPEQKLRGLMEQVEKHVREKGWQDRVMVHVCDEPFLHCVPSYRSVAKIVREAAPSLKVIEAVETTGLADVIDVMVTKLNHLNVWWPYFEKAKHAGNEVWFYTCCHPLGRYPNRFLDQPLIGTRQLHWICYLYGLDGYLHWGLNHFTPGRDPYSQEGTSQGLPLGDRAIVYPGKEGPVGSLRWSAMRDGLQDYEYLWVLENRLAALKKRLGADWLDPRQRPEELCRRVVQSFYDRTRDADVLLAARREIANEIEELAKPSFLYVQTEPPEGTTIPAGPRTINIRGVAEPGSTVTINGVAVSPVEPDGTFAAFLYLRGPTVTVEATKGGRVQRAMRRFRLVD
jgi:hypothetical protein